MNDSQKAGESNKKTAAWLQVPIDSVLNVFKKWQLAGADQVKSGGSAVQSHPHKGALRRRPLHPQHQKSAGEHPQAWCMLQTCAAPHFAVLLKDKR